VTIFNRVLGFFSATPRKTSIGVAFLKLIRAALGLCSIALAANYFGATRERDSWVLATSAVLIVTQVVFGPLNETLRTRFIHLRERAGEDVAIRTFNSVIGVALFVSLVVSILIVFFPDAVSYSIAPGFSDGDHRYLNTMVRWVFPSLLLSEISLLWTAVLNSYRSFFIPDVTGVFSAAITIVCMVVLSPAIGIYSLVVGMYAGLIFLLLILAHRLVNIRQGLANVHAPSVAAVKIFFLFSAPFYLPYVFGQGYLAFERILCTLIGIGSASVLDYARKFVDIPISVLTGVSASVLAPILAGLFSSGKDGEAWTEALKHLRMVVLGIAPIAIVLVVCSSELVEVLFARGAFAREQVEVTASTVMWFGVGVVSIAMYSVAGQVYIARQKVASYSLITAASFLFSMALSLFLYRRYGVPALALSWTAGHSVAALLLLLNMHGHRIYVFREVIRLLVIVGSVGILGWVAHTLVAAWVDTVPVLAAFVQLAVVAALSFVSILASMELFLMEERHVVYRLLTMKFRK
jgi:peptidoglycan biosynthesis protein MviN/MurJ (putative lipid II flippase)